MEYGGTPKASPASRGIANLAPGAYRLTLTAGKFLSDWRLRTEDASADHAFEITDHDLDNVRIVLSPGAGVTGEIRVLEEDAHIVPLPVCGSDVEKPIPIEICCHEIDRIERVRRRAQAQIRNFAQQQRLVTGRISAEQHNALIVASALRQEVIDERAGAQSLYARY